MLNLELRFLEASKLTRLSNIIDHENQGWRKLLDELTRDTAMPFEGCRPLPKLNLTLDSINLIEQQTQCNKSPSLALINYWSITGRRRPTVKYLLGYLHLCNLKWAEDFVCKSVLELDSIEQVLTLRKPIVSLAPQKTIASAKRWKPIDQQFKFSGSLVDELVSQLDNIDQFSFDEIYTSTNGFCDKPFNVDDQTGTRIGEGRFSSVYRAKSTIETKPELESQVIAIKLLKSEFDMNYLANELKLMRNIKHEHILELLGISLGKDNENSTGYQYICLVYPHMQNGSLLDCLSLGVPTKKWQHLSWTKRISIAIKAARGINHLHSMASGPIVHRDIKTANILIDQNIEPKVGDFTLVYQLKDRLDTATQTYHPVIGTSVYMAPEAFRGLISTKSDAFSFGIVLLELLTGMKPFDDNLDEDLFSFVTEKLTDIEDELDPNEPEKLERKRDLFLSTILDKKAGSWDLASAKLVFKLALQATESRKKDRLEVVNILTALESIPMSD